MEKKPNLTGKTITNIGIISFVKLKIQEIENYIEKCEEKEIKKEDIEVLQLFISKLEK